MIDEIKQAYQDLEAAQRAGDGPAATNAYNRLGKLIQSAALMPPPVLPPLPAMSSLTPIIEDRSTAEQRAEILQALFDAATSGNVPAALKWLELHPESFDEPAPAEPEKGKKTRKPKRPKKPSGRKPEVLTVREQRFIEHYFGDSKGNGTDAARKAGYAGNNNVLAVTACELLKKPKIQRIVQAQLDQAIMPLEHILKTLGEQARGTVEFFLELEPGKQPQFSLQKAYENGKLHLIKGISFNENNTVKSIQFYSALEASKTIGNFHRWLNPPKPKREPGDEEPEQAARIAEQQRDAARKAIDRIMQHFNLSEAEAAKKAITFFPAAREWLNSDVPAPVKSTEAVN
jgi:Terminase small subunit